jgi:hypothetical protein
VDVRQVCYVVPLLFVLVDLALDVLLMSCRGVSIG